MRKTLVLILSSFTCVASQYDCNVGCSLDGSIMGPSVCDDEGFTYQNACVAWCQGVTKFNYGSCDGMNESRLSGFDFPGSADVITMDVMNRFAHESFRFVTKRVKFATQLDDYEDVVESDLVDRLGVPLRSHFLRITSEGYEFMAPLESTQSTGTPGSSAANEGLAGQVDRKLLRDRNLIVIGTDTRSIVPDTTAFPFRAIGSADYNYTKGTSICTVTMISRTSALTAGHCVWRTSTNEPLPMMKVAPGRYVDASTGSMIDPYGTWDVDYTTTFQNYKEKDEQFDMAVVTFKPSNRPDLGCSNVYPGDVVGFVGIDRVLGTSSAVNDPRLASLTVTGYPNDYFGKMVTSNACSREALSGGSHYIWHFCDTVAGMSGSSFLLPNNVAVGVHAHGNWVSSRNGGAVLKDQLFDSVYTWAGLADQRAFVCSASNACPCSSQTNPSQRAICWFINFRGCLRLALESANRI
ncbi:hypothetical protein FisN_9Hh368 [Fistulifera solaris]|uniref:Serine protease n=1 Tax=Fistulifera solaris TaxID=1519565 RepID=A0A1Z5KD98_FISSO|nr:hypothetical protein FisN_9Hh368 [Fistulifera solaris]|eukprot:GAX24115.1 hypothetical protein FisN_9Hh368 [Fistulifera solaris]